MSARFHLTFLVLLTIFPAKMVLAAVFSVIMYMILLIANKENISLLLIKRVLNFKNNQA